MLPPSLPPSTRFNSPALHLQISPLPSPMISALPSPQLSALASPLIDTFPLSYGNYYGNPLHPNHSPAVSTPHSLHAELVTSHVSQTTLPLGLGDWSQELQVNFETQIARLTASAGLPLSWVDNPEWIDFIHQFLPAAKSPSRKVLMTRLIPHLVKDYRQVAKDSSRDQNATIQSDGWTGVNVRNFVFSTILSLIFQTSTTNSHAHSSLTWRHTNITRHEHDLLLYVMREAKPPRVWLPYSTSSNLAFSSSDTDPSSTTIGLKTAVWTIVAAQKIQSFQSVNITTF